MLDFIARTFFPLATTILAFWLLRDQGLAGELGACPAPDPRFFVGEAKLPVEGDEQ